MTSATRSVVFVVGLIVFAFLAAGTAETEKSVETSVATQTPAVFVTATQLFADYKANEVAADQKYKGKVVEVTGTVNEIAKDITDTIYVTLKGDQYFGDVQCFFDNQYEQAAATLKKGQTLKVKCRCDGKMMNVLLKGCSFK